MPSSDSPESWFGITDKRKRKQVQDKLAQRARRQRLDRKRDAAKKLHPQEQQEHDNHNYAQRQDVLEGISIDSTSPLDYTSFPNSQPERQYTELDQNPHEPQLPFWSSNPIGRSGLDFLSSVTSDESYVVIPGISVGALPMTVERHDGRKQQLSVAAALSRNGTMLGLVCGLGDIMRSKPAGSNIPLSLRPTPLQLEIPHLTWIDRFPFPRMRDNMISLGEAFDGESFIRELLDEDGFELIPGGLSYDPGAWRIEKDFAHRWGFLFN
jgi:hypothetical protein